MVKVMLHPIHADKIRHHSEPVESNVAGQISWRRLVEELRSAGEFLPNEKVEAFLVTDEGLMYFTKRR